jgi:glycogen debranching enzyme
VDGVCLLVADRTDDTVKPIKLSRTKIRHILGAGIKTHLDQWQDDANLHRGIPSELLEIAAPEIKTGHDDDGAYSEVVVPAEFPPGSILLFETDMEVSYAYIHARESADVQEISRDLDEICTSGADEAFGDLDLVDLNVVLHRADGEERDATGR